MIGICINLGKHLTLNNGKFDRNTNPMTAIQLTYGLKQYTLPIL